MESLFVFNELHASRYVLFLRLSPDLINSKLWLTYVTQNSGAFITPTPALVLGTGGVGVLIVGWVLRR